MGAQPVQPGHRPQVRPPGHTLVKKMDLMQYQEGSRKEQKHDKDNTPQPGNISAGSQGGEDLPGTPLSLSVLLNAALNMRMGKEGRVEIDSM